MPDDSISTGARQGPVRSLLADDPEFTEVLTAYLETMGEKRARLQALLATRDLGTLREEAHQLAGSAGGYGYPELSRLAAVMEDACRDGNADRALAAGRALLVYLEHIGPV